MIQRNSFSTIRIVGAHELPLQSMYHAPTHQRRSIRLKGYDYSQEGAYFITICTQNRESLFGKITDGEMRLNDDGEIVKKWWLELSNKFLNIKLDQYIVMPNHFHAIVIIQNNEPVVGAIHELPLQSMRAQSMRARRKMMLPKIIGYFKMNSAKQINQLQNTPGQHVWQRNYYEHIIRNEDDIYQIREYIKTNPQNWEKDNLY